MPQLLNVLKLKCPSWTKTFVYDDTKMLILITWTLNVMPGITGLLQINERNKTWYKYDIECIEIEFIFRFRNNS